MSLTAGPPSSSLALKQYYMYITGLRHFRDVDRTFNNSLNSFSHAQWSHSLPRFRRAQHRYVAASWKKPFCFSFPPENSRIKDRKSRCRYQNNLPVTHTVFLNYPCQKATAGKFRPETTDTAGKSRPSGARKGKARKSRQVTTDTAGKFSCQ